MERVEGWFFLSAEVKIKVLMSLWTANSSWLDKIWIKDVGAPQYWRPLSKTWTWKTARTSRVAVITAHSMCFCRSTAFWQSRGFSGRSSGLPGGSLLWPPVSGDQPAEQPGGEGVVRWPLWGTQEEDFLRRGEEAAGQDHAGVSGYYLVLFDTSYHVSFGNVMCLESICFFTCSFTTCRSLTTFWPPSLLLWNVTEEKERRAWWASSTSSSTSRPTAEPPTLSSACRTEADSTSWLACWSSHQRLISPRQPHLMRHVNFQMTWQD